MKIKIIVLTILLGAMAAQDCPEFGTDIIIHQGVQKIISLPPHQNVRTQLVCGNKVKVSWDKYWTSFLNQCYEDHYGYPPNPSRYSMYRSAGELWQEAYTAIGGVKIEETEYIDTPPYPGVWTYAVMANSRPPSGYDYWSPRASSTIDMRAPLPKVDDFWGWWSNQVELYWVRVPEAEEYVIYRGVDEYWADIYETLPPESNRWIDTNVEEGHVYYYDIAMKMCGQVGPRHGLIAVEFIALGIVEEPEKGDEIIEEEDAFCIFCGCDGSP